MAARKKKHRLTKKKKKLVESCYAMAYKLSRYWWERNRWTDLDDVTSAAMLGLCVGASLYDKSRGTAFSTYAYHAITTAIWQQIQTERKHRTKRSHSDPWALEDDIEAKESPEAGVDMELAALALESIADEAIKDLVRKYYYQGMTAKNIGESVGASTESARKWILKGIRTMQVSMRNRGILVPEEDIVKLGPARTLHRSSRMPS